MIEKKINFVLVYGAKANSYIKKDGTAAVKVRAYRNEEIKYLSTGVFLKPNQWNDKSKLVKNHDNATAFNQRLRDVVTQLETYEANQLKKFGSVSLKSLENAFRKDIDQTFTEFFRNQLNVRNMKPQSVKPHQTTLNKLLEFYKKEVPFDVLTYSFLKSFEKFLKDNNLSINTIHSHFKRIRTHLNEAIKYDLFLEDKNPFRRFKVPTEKTYKMPLIESELEELEQWIPNEDKKHLAFVRDFFLISCYSGLRFGDVTRLKPSNFTSTPNGLVLSIRTQKVNKQYEINTRLLFPTPGTTESKLEAVLSRYLHNHIFGESKEIFKITNQYANRAIKEIFAELPNVRSVLKSKVSTHYGRHTFATLLAQRLPAPIVQELLQHSDLKTSQIYFNHTSEQIEKALVNAFS